MFLSPPPPPLSLESVKETTYPRVRIKKRRKKHKHGSKTVDSRSSDFSVGPTLLGNRGSAIGTEITNPPAGWGGAKEWGVGSH